jgi:diguanylate cyclase (GGDEF)-like protein
MRHEKRFFIGFCGGWLAVLSFASASAGAGTPLASYVCRSWNTHDGLPQISVQAVAQTADGFLWLGTQEGLVRFDGVKFMVFNKKNTPEFRHSDIRALRTGRDGRLWIGTANGLLSYKDGAFATHFLGRNPVGDFISDLFEDETGTLWIGTSGGGLNRLQDGAFTTFTTRDGLAVDVVTSVWRSSDGVLWVGTANGLCRMKDGRITVFTGKDGLPSDFVTALRETSDRSLWVGTRRGLARYKSGRFRIFTTNDGLSSDSVSCIFEDRKGGIWIGTENKGVDYFDAGRFSAYTTSEGLSDNFILSIFQDREDIIWVGTYSGGLNSLWQGKFTNLTVRDGLPSKDARTVLESRDGSLWVGTRDGGLARLHDGTTQIFTAKDGLPDNTVRALFEDEDGTLWIGTNNGLSRFKEGRFTNFSRKDGLDHDYVRCIVRDSAGRLWVGTSGGGVHLFQGGRLVNYRDKGIPENVVRCFEVGRDGSLWIGSNTGLTRWQEGRVTNFSDKDGLPKDPIYAILEDDDQVLWLGSYGGGLCRLKDGHFAQFTVKEGLFDDVVYRILDDGVGNLWMSSNLGIFRVEKNSLNGLAAGTRTRIACVSYGVADGMLSSECNGNAQPAGWKTSDGRLWFPTNEGVVVVSPKNIPKNTLPPLVNVERVFVNRRAYPPGLKAAIPPGPGTLEFHFAGLSFIAPEKMRFRYKLEGYDPAWVEAGERREAYYTNMSPGTYRFMVIACNNDGLWNDAGATFDFTLKPHFYERTLFFGLVGVAVLLAGFGLMRWRIHRFQARERELTILIEARTKDLADVNRRLEDVNGRLEHLATHDGLTGIANYRHFLNTFDIEWRRSERQSLPLSLIMIDVDKFKAFNDRYGHQAGDQCLKTLATLFSETVTRAGDTVARYGGEEFVILLPETNAEGALSVAERVRKKVEAAAIKHEASPVCDHVTLSLGTATIVPTRDLAPEELIKASDRALYRAKRDGRNRSVAARFDEIGPAEEALPA